MILKDDHISSLAFVAAVYFLVAFIVIHYLRNDLDFVVHALSIYALGKNGIIIESGFVTVGLSQLLVALLLFNNFRAGRLFAGGLFLVFAGSGALIVAFFPVQPLGAELASRLPHILGAILQFLFFPLALIMLGRYMVPGQMRSYTISTAYFTSVMFVVVFILFLLKQKMEIPVFGLLEKMDIIAITSWLVIVSSRIYILSDTRALFSR